MLEGGETRLHGKSYVVETVWNSGNSIYAWGSGWIKAVYKEHDLISPASLSAESITEAGIRRCVSSIIEEGNITADPWKCRSVKMTILVNVALVGEYPVRVQLTRTATWFPAFQFQAMTLPLIMSVGCGHVTRGALAQWQSEDFSRRDDRCFGQYIWCAHLHVISTVDFARR